MTTVRDFLNASWLTARCCNPSEEFKDDCSCCVRAAAAVRRAGCVRGKTVNQGMQEEAGLSVALDCQLFFFVEDPKASD